MEQFGVHIHRSKPLMDIVIVPKIKFDALQKIMGVTDENVETQCKDTFFISINDPVGTDEVPYFKADHDNVKIMHFMDIDSDLNHPEYGVVKAFTEQQAVELFKFIERNKHKTGCVVHCAAGISRSGAVGSFIAEYIGVDYNEFKRQNPHILPNQHILSTLRRVARESEHLAESSEGTKSDL